MDATGLAGAPGLMFAPVTETRFLTSSTDTPRESVCYFPSSLSIEMRFVSLTLAGTAFDSILRNGLSSGHCTSGG